MSVTLLSDPQLAALHSNDRLDDSLRAVIAEEWERRGSPVLLKNADHTAAGGSGLPFRYKVALLLFPFLTPAVLTLCSLWRILAGRENGSWGITLLSVLSQGVFSSYSITPALAEGDYRRWREWWRFLCVGYVLWTILLLGAGFLLAAGARLTESPVP